MKAELHFTFETFAEFQKVMGLLSGSSIPVTLEAQEEPIKVTLEPLPALHKPVIIETVLKDEPIAPVVEVEPSETPMAVGGGIETERECDNCGNTFTPKRKDSRFCSKECYMKNYWKTYKPKDKKKSEVVAVPAEDKETHIKQLLEKLKRENPAPQRREPMFERFYCL